jgi:hypothetical protein
MAMEGRLGQLEIAITYLTGALQQLTEAQTKMDAALTRLADRMDQLAGVVTNMRGDLLELRYRQHAVAYFAPILRRIREVPPTEVERLADEAERSRRLAKGEYLDLLHADLVLTGMTHADAPEVFLVVEVSGTIDREDVERAARRAQLMGKASRASALAAVAGERITTDALEAARARGVRVVLDGRVTV